MILYEAGKQVTKSEYAVIDRMVDIYKMEYGYEPVFRKTQGGQFFIYKTDEDAQKNNFLTALGNVYCVEAWLGGAIMAKTNEL